MPRRSPPRGAPLRADIWYVTPILIEPEKVEGADPVDPPPAPVQARQGDIFKDFPNIWVESRPLRVARDFQPPNGGRIRYLATMEDDDRAYDWVDGEQVVVSATRGWAVLLTQDCELDKPRAMYTFAAIRPIKESALPDDIEEIRNRLKYRAFYLREQVGTFEQACVDFGRLTTVSKEALLASERHLSMTDDIRDALREDFIEFMTNDRGDLRVAGRAE